MPRFVARLRHDVVALMAERARRSEMARLATALAPWNVVATTAAQRALTVWDDTPPTTEYPANLLPREPEQPERLYTAARDGAVGLWASLVPTQKAVLAARVAGMALGARVAETSLGDELADFARDHVTFRPGPVPAFRNDLPPFWLLTPSEAMTVLRAVRPTDGPLTALENVPNGMFVVATPFGGLQFPGLVLHHWLRRLPADTWRETWRRLATLSPTYAAQYLLPYVTWPRDVTPTRQDAAPLLRCAKGELHRQVRTWALTLPAGDPAPRRSLARR